MVSVGAPFGAVGNLRTLELSGTSARVTWTAPTRLGGSGIERYVVTAGGLPPQRTSTTEVTLTDLTTGTMYVVTVYPVNTSGIDGPSASVVFQLGGSSEYTSSLVVHQSATTGVLTLSCPFPGASQPSPRAPAPRAGSG